MCLSVIAKKHIPELQVLVSICLLQVQLQVQMPVELGGMSEKSSSGI
jgi:hypothetical protein